MSESRRKDAEEITMLYFSLILFATSSLILCVYRDTAVQRGYQIGTFFLSGKAWGQGWAGIICARVFSLWKTDFWGLVIVASVSFLLALPAVLA